MKGIIAYREVECSECPACQATMKNGLTKLESIERDGPETARNSEPRNE